MVTLGMVLSDFKRPPLEDRDALWILSHLRTELEQAPNRIPRLSDRSVESLRLLLDKLEMAIRTWDSYDYPERQ